jgi:transposase
MIVPPAGVRVLVATQPIDFRKGADSLTAIVQTVLRHDPFSGTIYVFRCKRADRVKLLVWDGSGLVPEPVAGADPLRRRWPDRDRLQHRRAIDAADCSQS